MVNKESTSLGEAFNLISQERSRQDVLHPDNDHSPEYWLAILSEEVGEVAKEVVDRNNLENLRNELIQVAATAIRFLQSIPKPGPIADSNLISQWIRK